MPVPNINSPQNPNTATGSTFNNAVGTEAQIASNTNPAYNQAVSDYQTAQQQLQESKTNEANTLALNSENPIPLEFQQGRGQIIQNQYLSQQDALAQQMAAAQGLGSMGTTQQSAQQNGLASVGNLLSPVTQYGALVNPATGQPISSSGLISTASSLPAAAQSALSALPQTAQSAIMLEAQKVQNNQETLSQAQSNLSAYGQGGNTALNAVLGPGFNANTNAGASAGQQQVAGTGGAITSQQQTQVAGYKSASQQAQNLGLQLNQLIGTTGVNPSDINAVNLGLQKIASNTSDGNYKTFQNLINDIASTYAQVLVPPGGSADDMTRTLAASMLDSSMKGSGISQVMQNLDAQVQAKISGVMTNNNGTSNTNTTSGGSLYSF